MRFVNFVVNVYTTTSFPFTSGTAWEESRRAFTAAIEEFVAGALAG